MTTTIRPGTPAWIVLTTHYLDDWKARGACWSENEKPKLFPDRASAENHRMREMIAWLYERVGEFDEEEPPHDATTYWTWTRQGVWRLREPSMVDQAIMKYWQGTCVPYVIDWTVAEVEMEEAVEPPGLDDHDPVAESVVATVEPESDDMENDDDDHAFTFDSEWHAAGLDVRVRHVDVEWDEDEMRRGVALTGDAHRAWARTMIPSSSSANDDVRIEASANHGDVWIGTLGDASKTGFVFSRDTWEVECPHAWRNLQHLDLFFSMDADDGVDYLTISALK